MKKLSTSFFSFSFNFANPFAHTSLLLDTRHPFIRHFNRAQKDGDRVVMATRFLRGPPTLNAILARKDRLRRKSRRTKGDEDTEGARVSISAAEFSTESDHPVERGTFQDWVVTHPSASLSTLPGLYFPRLPLVFLFSSLRFLFSTRVHMYRRETFGNFWRNGSFNSASFLRSNLDYTRERSLYVRAGCWKLEKKRNSAPKCSDASIIKSEGGKRDGGMRADSYTTKFIIFNYFLFPPGINGRSLKLY